MQFVDYGNNEVIRIRSIVCLSMDLLNVPQLAQLYRFEGVLAPLETTSEYFKKVCPFGPNLCPFKSIKNNDKVFTIDLRVFWHHWKQNQVFQEGMSIWP